MSINPAVTPRRRAAVKAIQPQMSPRNPPPIPQAPAPAPSIPPAPAPAPSSARAVAFAPGTAPVDVSVDGPPALQRKPTLHRDNSWLAADNKKPQHFYTHKVDRSRSGQGPFKHSQSLDHAIFAIRATAQDVTLALGRMDPNAADIDGVTRGNDRALLAGMDVLIEHASKAETNAEKYLKYLAGAPGGAAAGRGSSGSSSSSSTTGSSSKRGPLNPRAGLKEQLASSAKMARAALHELEYHHKHMWHHVDVLNERLVELEYVYFILLKAIDEKRKHGLTKGTGGGGGGGGDGGLQSPRPSSSAAGNSAAGPPSPPPSSPRPPSASSASSATIVPWSHEENELLLELIKTHGLHKWQVVASELAVQANQRSTATASSAGDAPPPRAVRPAGVCERRWHTLLDAYLSVQGISGLPRTAELLLAARKASRVAEGAMNDAAGQLNRAKSQLSVASMAAQRLLTDDAHRRGWLRTHTHVQLHGPSDSEEHNALRLCLTQLGPAGILRRKLEEVDRKKAGLDAVSIENELKLRALVIEVGKATGGVGSKPRHYLVVRNVETGEICLSWEESMEQRSTDPDPAAERSKLTRSLHGGAGGGGGGGGGGDGLRSGTTSAATSRAPSVAGD